MFQPITARQLRSARVLLGMSQKELAEASDVSTPTIQRLESLHGELQGYNSTITRIEQAITARGVAFFKGGAILKDA